MSRLPQSQRSISSRTGPVPGWEGSPWAPRHPAHPHQPFLAESSSSTTTAPPTPPPGLQHLQAPWGPSQGHLPRPAQHGHPQQACPPLPSCSGKAGRLPAAQSLPPPELREPSGVSELPEGLRGFHWTTVTSGLLAPELPPPPRPRPHQAPPTPEKAPPPPPRPTSVPRHPRGPLCFPLPGKRVTKTSFVTETVTSTPPKDPRCPSPSDLRPHHSPGTFQAPDE